MKVTTKLTVEIATGRVLEHEFYEYSGQVALCKGASDNQKAISDEERKFYSTMTSNYGTVFANNQAILASLKNAWMPILSKGASQEGFSPEEKAARMAQVTEGTARNYAQATAAAHRAEAAMGGGTEVIPSGVNLQLDADMAARAAAEQSQGQNQVIQENFATGRRNFENAASMLGGVASQYDPTGYAKFTNAAGDSAMSGASAVQQADTAASPWGVVGGLLGGATGVFTNGLANMGMSAIKKATSGSNSGTGGNV